MPPIAVVPIAALAALGGIVACRWAAREFRRVNAALDELRTTPEPFDRSQLRTLRRDPATGEYRLH